MKREIECYFWIEGDHETEDAIIRTMCQKCHEEKSPWLGWYYKGEAGPWQYQCSKCDTIILESIEADYNPKP